MSALPFPKYGEPVGQAIMRKALRTSPPSQSAADVWASLPIATRQSLAQRALGIPGVERCKLPWTELQPHERIRIGVEARRIGDRLL